MNQTIKTFFFSLALLLIININAQNKQSDYEKLWKQVEEFTNDALPKSALKVVEDIYNIAVKENNEKQIIKSIVHRMSNIKALEEDGVKNTIMKLESEMKNYSGVVKPFMHLFLVKMYDEYFNMNAYEINQRSVTSDFENKDMATWDKTKFLEQVIKNYQLAMDNILKKENMVDYSDFIDEAKESATIFPTLYDFVAYYAINQLGGEIGGFRLWGRKSNEDKFKDNAYLSNIEVFVNLTLSGDTLSYNYTALKIFQNWLQFRLQHADNKEALINTDLERLRFVKTKLITADGNTVWENALISLQKKYNNIPELSQINWELAKHYNQLGESYNFLDSATLKYKTYKKKAMDLLNDAMTRFPKAKYYAACHDLKLDIEEVILRFEVQKTVNANEKFPLKITYRNTDYFSMKIYKCDYEKFINLKEERYSEKYFPELIKNSKEVSHIKSKTLTGSEDYNTHYTEYLTDPLPFGFYVIVLETKANTTVYQTVFSSDLCMVTKGDNNNYSDLYILNQKTGQPVENAKIELYSRDYDYKQNKSVYNKHITVHTDKNGYAKIKITQQDSWKDFRIDVSYKNDFISDNSNFYPAVESKEQKRVVVNFFTDRAIYRPGQTVHFKGICLEKLGNETKILPKHSAKVTFKDVNWQDIASLNLVSNEYGTFSGSFTIPTGVLTGNFTIQTNNGSHYIQVEEYKRPMFEVKMLPVEGEYKLNDNVAVEGTATTYAGTALTDAKVSYTVVRNPIWRPWYAVGGMRYGVRGMGYPASSPVEIAFGDLVLDNEGKFKVNFKALVDEIELLQNYVAYNYTVNITATDMNGETQTGSTSVLVANRALELSSNLKQIITKEKIDTITISTQNVSGIFVPANVEIEVFKLKDNENLLLKKRWEIVDQPLYSKEEWYKQYPGHEYKNETDFSNFNIEKTVFQKKINTANTKTIKFDGAEKWSSGVYRLVLKSIDKWGNPVKSVQEFVLFSEKDKKTPYNATDFYYVDKTSVQPGQSVNLYVGSAFQNVNLYYDLEAQGKTIKTETIKLSAEIKKITIPIEDSYRGNMSVNLFFVKEGSVFEYKQTLVVDWENKKLDLKFVTYRDKTLPGANETWQLKISDYLSKPAAAEFMASMYDASLDIFAKNSWSLNPYPTYFSSLVWNGLGFNTLTSTPATYGSHRERLFKGIMNPYLNLFDIYSSYSGYGKYFGMRATEMALCGSSEVGGKDALRKTPGRSEQTGNSINSTMKVMYDMALVEEVEGGTADTQSQEPAPPPPPIQIRSNFAETAFFYPNVTTNEAGEVFLNFTMPESLTRWNFMGLAHTKDLKIGTINEEIITQKELMVMPNLPRFFRENDKMTISAKINNISETDITGTAKIEFYDVEGKGEQHFAPTKNIPFSVLKNGNTIVEWHITIPEGLSAIGVRIIAEGKNHSDGEERILPILSNKMLVTESMPLPVRKAGTTNFTLNSLKNNNSTTLRHESYTLEYTANPAWYAVQALPYLMEYPHECAEQVFSRFYANSLSAHIANSDPKIKRIFELWKTIPDSKALLSNLEKNQELKALLIEETPWLLNAKSESERKRNIAILFDLNRLANEKSTAVKKLSEMQAGNGGFPWFKGMRESWYITQHIVGGFGHLDKLGVTEVRKNSTIWNMLKKAVQFLDKELEKSYSDLKRYCDTKCLEKDNLGYMQIHYLYVRSFFINDVPIEKSTEEAFNYYKKQAIQYWTKKDFYMQGMIGLALNKYGEKTVPSKIVASLKERALSSEEMGTYWKYNNGCYWYQAPIETQSLLIELFTDVTKDKNMVEEMKVWLLKQKQTQDWKTTKATTEAIYALLLQGTNLLAETDYPIIKIADMTIDAAADPEIKTEAGTGYFKKRWDGTLITPEWSKVSVTKKANSVSWGAVYWQYFEQLDKIKQFEETPLTIKKQLFVERRQNDKSVIVPIENDGKLQIGDKVKVRIEIRVDRDMEYVHLKDMRAACFEPVDYLSGYRYKSGFGYYQGIKDASMNFFIDYLQKGTYVFEYELRVSQKGEFSNGITTIQSMYAPEFTSHSEGVRVVVRDI